MHRRNFVSEETWFKLRPSLELQEVVCLDDGILFLWWRLAGCGSEGGMIQQHHQGWRRRNKSPGSFSYLLRGVLCTNPKQTCQWLSIQNQNKQNKESYTQSMTSLPDLHRKESRLKHHDQSWASEWMRREPSCWQALLHQAGWGLHHLPYTHLMELLYSTVSWKFASGSG